MYAGKVKLSVFFDHIRTASQQSQRSLEQVLGMVKESGIEGVELDFDAVCECRQQTVLLLERAGLRVSSIYGTCRMGEDPEDRKPWRIVDMAEEMGARRVLIVPGFLPKKEAQELEHCSGCIRETESFMENNEYVQNMKRSLRKLVSYAEPKQVTVTLEDFDSSRAPYARMAQLKWFMEQVPGLKLTFDTGNFAYSNEDVLQAYELLKSYVVHVHCKDRKREPGYCFVCNKGLASVAAGDGYIPLEQVLHCLADGGYDGYCAIEHFGLERQYEGIQRSAEYLSRIVL